MVLSKRFEIINELQSVLNRLFCITVNNINSIYNKICQEQLSKEELLNFDNNEFARIMPYPPFERKLAQGRSEYSHMKEKI